MQDTPFDKSKNNGRTRTAQRTTAGIHGNERYAGARGTRDTGTRTDGDAVRQDRRLFGIRVRHEYGTIIVKRVLRSSLN